MIGFKSVGFLVLSAALAGFAYSVSLTAVFHIVSGENPTHLVNRATAIVVLGCSKPRDCFGINIRLILESSHFYPNLYFSVLGVFMMASTLAALSLINKTRKRCD